MAPEIVKYVPKKVKRIIEPFAGTGAVSILAEQYSEIWHGQFSENENNIDYFFK